MTLSNLVSTAECPDGLRLSDGRTVYVRESPIGDYYVIVDAQIVGTYTLRGDVRKRIVRLMKEAV